MLNSSLRQDRGLTKGCLIIALFSSAKLSPHSISRIPSTFLLLLNRGVETDTHSSCISHNWPFHDAISTRTPPLHHFTYWTVNFIWAIIVHHVNSDKIFTWELCDKRKHKSEQNNTTDECFTNCDVSTNAGAFALFCNFAAGFTTLSPFGETLFILWKWFRSRFSPSSSSDFVWFCSGPDLDLVETEELAFAQGGILKTNLRSTAKYLTILFGRVDRLP